MTIYATLAWAAMAPTALLALSSSLAYFSFRVYTLLEAQDRAHEASSLVLAWVFLAIEICTLLPNLLSYCLRALAWHRPDRKRRRLAGDDVPTVDVLITCCNEDIDTVLDTVRAACMLDYPQDRFRVFVCDDGRSEEVFDRITLLSSVFRNLHYVSRPKPTIPDYKAGNLNNALDYSRALPYSTLVASARLPSPSTQTASASSQNASPEPCRERKDFGPCAVTRAHSGSDFVAGLDADMICMPYLLRAQLPHILDDAQIAMTCPPQTFYDTPINDPLTQNMLQFAGLTEVVNDALGHADCLGSGYIMRRTALESIGGFPTESLSEDVCCSAKLLGMGWKTIFVPEILQYGSVPESYLAHVKQRTRWWIGHIQTSILLRFRTSREWTRHLSMCQRLTGVCFDLRQWIQVPLALNYITIPLSLYAGYPLVIWNNDFELALLIRSVCIWNICHWIHQGIMGRIAGDVNGRYDSRIASYDAELEQWLAPYIFRAWLRSFVLPRRFGGCKTGFTSSGSISSELKERDRKRRMNVWRRLYVILWLEQGGFHVLFMGLCLGGLMLTYARSVDPKIPSLYTVMKRTPGDQRVYLITRIGWPPVIWLQYLHASVIPLLYAMFPPDTNARDELLRRDIVTGVAYPRLEATETQKSFLGGWRYARAVVVMLWVVILFALSFSLRTA